MAQTLKTWCDKHNCERQIAYDSYHCSRRTVCNQCKNESKTVEQRKDAQLKHVYGISLIEYKLILESQGGRCAICLTDDPRNGNKKEFCVDHDHVTNKVRGLLCVKCNSGLGMFKDSLAAVINAAEYLKKHGKE